MPTFCFLFRACCESCDCGDSGAFDAGGKQRADSQDLKTWLHMPSMQGHLRQSSILAMVAADVGKALLLKTVTVTTSEEDFHVCI
jgi:hypothetical protein